MESNRDLIYCQVKLSTFFVQYLWCWEFMKLAAAFAPANISLIFTIDLHDNPAKMGSRGVGFTVDKGVTARVFCQTDSFQSKKSLSIKFNGKPIDFATVETVLNLLNVANLGIDLQSDLPLGCGFGLSGASALATAYAVNKLFKLGKTKKELAKLAHLAEVKNRTGLGDVVNQYFGGFLIKRKVSSAFAVSRLPFAGIKIYYRIFSPLPTKNIIGSRELKKNINEAGEEALKQIRYLAAKKRLTMAKILDISYQFVKQSDLPVDKKVILAIEELRKKGAHATMILLGNGLLSDTKFPESLPLTITEKKATLC